MVTFLSLLEKFELERVFTKGDEQKVFESLKVQIIEVFSQEYGREFQKYRRISLDLVKVRIIQIRITQSWQYDDGGNMQPKNVIDCGTENYIRQIERRYWKQKQKTCISNCLPLWIFRKLIKKSVNGSAKGSFLTISVMDLLGVSF